MTPPGSEFFDCEFLYASRAVAGPEPYVVFADEETDPFAATFFRTCRGEGAFAGVVAEPRAAAAADGLVFMDAVTWHRNHRALRAAGVRGPRVRVLLYFDSDPSGFWDFAKACGPALGEVYAAGRLGPASLAALEEYLERWLGGRALNGRLLPMTGTATRDFGDVVARSGPAISRVMAALADDESRAAYARIVYGTQEQIFGAFASHVFGEQQYMEIARLKPGDHVVNCGVGRGWEIPYFLCRMRGEGRIYNCDPNIGLDSGPFGALLHAFTPLLSDLSVIIGDRDGTIDLPVGSFDMVLSEEAYIAQATDAPRRTYPMRSIDSLCASGEIERVDFLKMDVEGGELAILRGALDTLKRQRPKLAVAVYHEPDHLWDYPGFLLDHLEDYRFYVRQYGYTRFETLLYAIPAEQADSRSGEETLIAAGAAPRAGSEIVAYLHDLEPRQYYTGPRRILTRFSGTHWSLGRLDAVPPVQADEVFALFEAPAGRVVLTRHGGGGDADAITGGVFRSDVERLWTASRLMPAGRVYAPAPGDDAEPVFAAYDPAEGLLELHLYADEVFQLLARFPWDRAPRLVERRGSRLSVHSLAADGLTLTVAETDLDGAVGESRDIALPAPFAGLASAKLHRDGRSSLTPAWGVREAGSGRISFFSLDGGALRPLAEIEIDDSVRLIPVFRCETAGPLG